jgi:hypothetical protein
VFAQEQNEQVRVVATRIEWDGTMQRGVVDTGHCGGGPQWEDLTARALAVPPPYRPVPGTPVYHVGLDDGTVVLVAEHDLCGALLDLVTAVLAMGGAVLTRSPVSPIVPQALLGLSQLSHRLAGRHRTQMPRAGHLLDPDLRLRIWAHSPDARY